MIIEAMFPTHVGMNREGNSPERFGKCHHSVTPGVCGKQYTGSRNLEVPQSKHGISAPLLEKIFLSAWLTQLKSETGQIRLEKRYIPLWNASGKLGRQLCFL